MVTPGSPTPTPTPTPILDAAVLARELEEVRQLSAELAVQIEKVIAQQRELEELSSETNAELLVLLTALRPLRLANTEPPVPRPIDEYIEDMIDPEFGLRPARRMIVAAAEKILNGDDALRFPTTRGRAPGRSLDED